MSQSVLHCVSSLQVGGAEKCAVNLATHQHHQGLTVAVLSFGKKDEPFQAILAQRGIPVFNINGSVFSRARKALSVIKQFNLIHIHSPSVIRALLPIAPFLYRRKVLYTHHGELSAEQKGMRLSHWVAAGYIDKDFAVSSKVRESVRTRFNWNPKHTQVVANGVIVPETPVTLGSSPFRFGCVARMVPLKQIDGVVEAFAESGIADNCELHLFGDGPERDKIETAIDRLNVRNKVVVHGNVLDEDAIYKHIDCLVINSTTEGLPMALLEALARGKAAICTRVGEIPVLNKEQRFCLFTEGTTPSLANQMRVIAEDPALWNTLATNGKALVKDKYAIDDVSAFYLSV